MPVFNASGCVPAIFRALGWFLVCAATVFLLEAYSLGLMSSPLPSTHEHQPVNTQPLPTNVRYQKPVGPQIIGLIFYGRRDRVALLDCYLKQNLVINGGWLDEVIWAVNTHDAEDLDYLEELIPTSPLYRRLDCEGMGAGGNSYSDLWSQSVEHGNIYVKIDDDVVYIHEDTIPLLVHTLSTDHNAVAVSANLINSPELNWLHYRTGAVRPYLPDLSPPSPGSLSTIHNPVWKASELPSWDDNRGWTSPSVEKFTKELSKFLPGNADHKQSATLPLHRWLPLDDPLDISKTPIAQTAYDPFGPGWSSWAIAAQQHYSFLHNLEMGELSSYYISHGFRENSSAIWDHTGDRLSINVLAVAGDVILDNIAGLARSESDETFLSMELPHQLNKRLFVHTQAIASHYAFRTQMTLDSTDVLSRYRAYAIANACPGSMVTPNWE